MRPRGGDLAEPARPAGTTGSGGCAAWPDELETAEAADVLSAALHAWAAAFMRSLRMHKESANSAQTAPAAAEAVRRLRRASRRMGSALHTYRAFVDAAWAEELSAELRRLSGTLAYEYRCAARQARLLSALHRLAVDGPGADRAAALLERQHTLARGRAHSAALEALVSSRFHAVADAVALLAYEVPLAPDAPVGPARALLVPPAERAWERLVRAVESLPSPRSAVDHREEDAAPPAGRGPGGAAGRAGHDARGRQDAAWLEVRILLRHHRYAREVLWAAGGPPDGATEDGRGRGAGEEGPDGDGFGAGFDAGLGAALGDGLRAGPGTGPGPGSGTAAARAGRTADTGGGGRTGRPRAPADAHGTRCTDGVLAAAGVVLDAHRDAVEAAEAAAAAARTPRIAPATAYALGVLHAGQRHEAESARREFAGLWREVADAGPAAVPQSL